LEPGWRSVTAAPQIADGRSTKSEGERRLESAAWADRGPTGRARLPPSRARGPGMARSCPVETSGRNIPCSKLARGSAGASPSQRVARVGKPTLRVCGLPNQDDPVRSTFRAVRGMAHHGMVSRSREPTRWGSHDGGGSGIRTHETLRPAGFQDRCIQPLCHPSATCGAPVQPTPSCLRKGTGF